MLVTNDMNLRIGQFGRAIGVGNGLARYSIDGNDPSLILDFPARTYAVDANGWVEAYAVGGERPDMILNFASREYGA